MTSYSFVDADSHIVEMGGTWESYLEAEYAARRPVVIDNPWVPGRPERDKSWFVEGALQPRHQGPGGVVMSTPAEMAFARRRPVAPEVQSLADPRRRAAHMREIGIARTVMFSTFFLQPPSSELGYEAALMRAWNRWAADRCAHEPEMLRFAAVVPIRSTHLAVQELRHARELGAAAVMILASAGDTMLHERALDPFWAEAQALQMPVAVHFGWPNPRITNTAATSSSVYLGADAAMWWAYVSLFAGGIFDRFPRLKVAIVEHEARWLRLFLDRAAYWYATETAVPWSSAKTPEAVLREHPIYFSFDGDIDYLPEFLQVAGEDRVLGASDFPHTHYQGGKISTAMDLIAEHGALTEAQKRKVLRDNALAFYGWPDV